MKKTAFIAIVGRPNVGKSTLLNSILGEKVAIVSKKPQTTRNRITGIHTVGENQFVFLDTPGIHKPRTKLGDFMVKTSSKRYTRKNGSSLEESQLSKMDESSTTVYYCGEEFPVHTQYFYKATSLSCAYQKGDYCFAADDRGVICFKGEHTFVLSYTDEN
jgi:hypothetical protein